MPGAFLMSVRGLDDDELVDLLIYDDHVECLQHRTWLLFRRKRSRRSMTYQQIMRAVFRAGAWFGLVHLEDNSGTVINVHAIPVDLMQRAEQLLRERISPLGREQAACTGVSRQP